VGRRSLAGVRRTQILDALERCILRHGLAGSSLARIAGEAGVQTSVIAHYFGNRAGLLEALTQRLVRRYEALFASLQEGPLPSVEAGLALLFPDELQDLDLARISRELVGAARDDETVRACLREAHTVFEDTLFEMLGRWYPEAPEASRRMVALGLLCLSEGSAQLQSCDMRRARVRARGAARALVGTLES
jgi:AcrR family transcriptional regulator